MDPTEMFAKEEGLLEIGAIPAENEVDARWCLRLLRTMRDVAFATVDEDGLPSVRVIDVMAVTSDRLYFLAPRGKAFHQDVMREQYVAVVGKTDDYRTCRIRGNVTRPPDAEQRALVDALFALNPGMEIIYPGDARYICDVFYLGDGEGEYFDLGQRPIFRKQFSLGTNERLGTFFMISGQCARCGTCASICPEGCITEGSPYIIEQCHCIRCGLCAEECPVGAITRKG